MILSKELPLFADILVGISCLSLGSRVTPNTLLPAPFYYLMYIHIYVYTLYLFFKIFL